jgi:hypothetical protein
MVTTIQVDEKTILLLRKLKIALATTSYDETINKMAAQHMHSVTSMAGSLKKYVGEMSREEILKGLRDKDDRI